MTQVKGIRRFFSDDAPWHRPNGRAFAMFAAGAARVWGDRHVVRNSASVPASQSGRDRLGFLNALDQHVDAFAAQNSSPLKSMVGTPKTPRASASSMTRSCSARAGDVREIVDIEVVVTEPAEHRLMAGPEQPVALREQHARRTRCGCAWALSWLALARRCRFVRAMWPLPIPVRETDNSSQSERWAQPVPA